MLAVLFSPVARWLIAMAVGAAVLAGIWLHGYRTASNACEAEQLRAELAAARRDLTISQTAAADATRRATRPDARCALTGDDLRGVLGKP
ncbi:MAG: hypothetical protein DI549_12445 [Ancylobacter novellus]|uniref:Uncharacterized protein n=1 Tax=Ancylobacter novellus TaxID=921 RepID=A0A2W5SH58_ANCNO|nr:MAG: hypothetical protein DI549_12445 [Ancylobacter novellus]